MSVVGTINRYIDHAADQGIVLAALMMSPDAFITLKQFVPRNQYRKRQGTRFVNAYRGIPIEIHDEWSWGWMLRAANGTFLELTEDQPA